MSIKYYSVVVILIIFFSGCETRPRENSSISVIKDVPEFFQTKSWKYEFGHLQWALGIKPIDDGFVEWQIRLWIGHGYTETDSTQLLIFKKESNRISGVLYTYVSYSKTIDTTVNLFKRITPLSPISGWASFIKGLENLGIYDLPDYNKLKGYKTGMDSYGVTVEVATSHKYRIYDYPDYEINVDQFAEAKKMLGIVREIEREFKIRAYY